MGMANPILPRQKTPRQSFAWEGRAGKPARTARKGCRWRGAFCFSLAKSFPDL